MVIPTSFRRTYLVNTRPFLACLAAFWLVSAPLSAEEDYDDLLQEQIEESLEKSEQMPQTDKDDIVEQVMENPEADALYEQHLEQGGTLSEEDFAYMYGATGGQTQEAINRYNQAAQENHEEDAWWKFW
jgi:hypothetical protein